MTDLRTSFEAVSRVYQQVDGGLSAQGGIENILSMQRSLREALFAISSNDLTILLDEIERAKQSLDALKTGIVELRSLKEAFKTTMLP